MFSKLGSALASLAAATLIAMPVGAQLKVVTSTTDLYDIAKAVGGNRITATHIGEGYQHPHFSEAKPSFVLQLRNAALRAVVGLALEIGWRHRLLAGRHHAKRTRGRTAHVGLCSRL